jgi:hypothetical protein
MLKPREVGFGLDIGQASRLATKMADAATLMKLLGESCRSQTSRSSSTQSTRAPTNTRRRLAGSKMPSTLANLSA